MAAVLAWLAGELAQAATGGDRQIRHSVNWQPWILPPVAKLNAEGKPVFVDFTAAWCVSCQANKRLVLTRAEIEQAFAQECDPDARRLTNRDERITQAGTHRDGPSGVPVYVLHAPENPQLFAGTADNGIVKEALAAL